MPGLDDHPYLGRIRLQRGDPGDQRRHRRRGVLHPGHLEHAFTRPAQRHQVKLLRPVDTNSQHGTTPSRRDCASRNANLDGDLLARHVIATHRRRGAVLMDQSSRDSTLVGVGPSRPPPGTPSHLSPRRTSTRSVPEGDLS